MKILRLMMCSLALLLTCNTYASDDDENLSAKHFEELVLDIDKLEEHLKHYNVNAECFYEEHTLLDIAVSRYASSKEDTYSDFDLIRYLLHNGARTSAITLEYVLKNITKISMLKKIFKSSLFS